MHSSYRGRAPMRKFNLTDFVNESNYIEGIKETTGAQVAAHERFLEDPLSVESLEKLVFVLQPGAKLRERAGMDVYVGNHVPPPGGAGIRYQLEHLLNLSLDTPWQRHCKYETLHPFMDGNGRSGRALWLKDMGGIEKTPIGFLHHFYYQTLQERRVL